MTNANHTWSLLMRILYADDDADERYFFTEALKSIDRSSIECVTASDGAEALLKLSTDSNFNFIFLDLNMPVVSGAECLQAIKDDPRLKEIPVVVYSNAVEKKHESHLRRLGAVKILHKKWNISELSAELQRLFEERNAVAKLS